MKRIYTGIDLGSYSIKIVVSEVIDNKFHVLASTNTRCRGIKNGIITDFDEAKIYLTKAKQNVEEMLGISINEAIVTVSSDERKFNMTEASINIENETKMVTSDEIAEVFKEASIGRVDDDYELVAITPISFQVDNQDLTKDPKGMVGEQLKVKAVITSIPKENFKSVISLLKECNIEAVDVTLGVIGDYYEVRNPEFNNGVSAIINIGYEKIETSIFNKGIMIKNEIIEQGSKLIDRDLASIYGLKRSQARKLKESFAVSNTRYSDINNTIEITNKNGEIIVLNQLEVSEIVESRLVELLKLAKKQINLLTNREISNIIITGGISELAGFEYVVENVLDRKTQTLNINTMGIRNNMYSSCLGIIKYFHYKLDLRGLSYSMIGEQDSNIIKATKSKVSSNDNIISKVFGYFVNEN